MIDKITSGNPYDYPKVTQKTDNSAGNFVLEEALRQGVVYEKKQDNAKRQDVILELSADSTKKEREEEPKKVSTSSELTFEQIKKTVLSAIRFFKDTWRLIWEDTPADAVQRGERVSGAEEKEARRDEFFMPSVQEQEQTGYQSVDTKQAEVNQVVRSGNLDALTAMLTNNGKTKPARNSGLLTTYDRMGRIIELDATEEERILHGEKKFIKL